MDDFLQKLKKVVHFMLYGPAISQSDCRKASPYQLPLNNTSYYSKEFQKVQAKLDTNIRVQEKSLDSKLREQIQFEFPTWYQAEIMISYQLLNHDVEALSRYCERKQ